MPLLNLYHPPHRRTPGTGESPYRLGNRARCVFGSQIDAQHPLALEASSVADALR